MLEQRNLIIAIVLSMAVLFGFEYFFGSGTTPQEETLATAAEQDGSLDATAPSAGDAPSVSAPGGPAPATAAAAAVSRDSAIARDSRRIEIKTPSLHGSLRLKGGRIDDLTLVNYTETTDPTSPEIELFSPTGAPYPYYAEFGWVPADKSVAVPGGDTPWTSSATELTPDSPVRLTWNNGQGLIFTKTVAVDANFMFTVTQTVENTGDADVALFPYGLISRVGKPAHLANFYILHEGPLGVFDGTLKEVDYDDLKDDKLIKHDTTGGWLGITDKYWLAALAPDQSGPVTARFVYQARDGRDGYQTDFLGTQRVVAPGATTEVKSNLFAGAKEVSLLDRYEQTLGITNFDLAVDFGWFYFLTKPFFYCLDYLYGLLGNMGVAIIVFTIALKALFFPLANKSYRSLSKMKLLQPEMKRLQERFKDDRQRLNQELMGLYKREKVNPMSGCLPIVIQIPVFFALYKVLFVSIEMRHAPFFGWIQDLSAPDPTSLFNLFGLIPWTPPEMMMIGVWPLLMGISMFLQQKLNPTPTDPTQAKIMMFLPIIFTFMLAHFAAGLVIYWTFNNLLSIAQQWAIMKRMGAKP